jgi:hypothetical protein
MFLGNFLSYFLADVYSLQEAEFETVKYSSVKMYLTLFVAEYIIDYDEIYVPIDVKSKSTVSDPNSCSV